MDLSPSIRCARAHLTHGGRVPAGPWNEALWMHRQPLPSTAAVTLLTTAVFAASVCQVAFWCHLWLVCQSAAFSQM